MKLLVSPCSTPCALLSPAHTGPLAALATISRPPQLVGFVDAEGEAALPRHYYMTVRVAGTPCFNLVGSVDFGWKCGSRPRCRATTT